MIGVTRTFWSQNYLGLFYSSSHDSVWVKKQMGLAIGADYSGIYTGTKTEKRACVVYEDAKQRFQENNPCFAIDEKIGELIMTDVAGGADYIASDLQLETNTLVNVGQGYELLDNKSIKIIFRNGKAVQFQFPTNIRLMSNNINVTNKNYKDTLSLLKSSGLKIGETDDDESVIDALNLTRSNQICTQKGKGTISK